MPQFSNSGRVVTVVAVIQGQVYAANAGDGGWTPTTNSTGANPPLNFNGLVYSTCNNQQMFFADGVNRVRYVPASNTCFPWIPTAGQMPADSDNNFHRLICTWRGRIVVAGLQKDPQNWFMSAIADPFNWDYGPASPNSGQAVAGDSAPQGLIGDVVTSLCPYTDDVLIAFGDSSIHMFRGDPGAGGEIDLISERIGGVWGICWEKDPYGNVYFVSNQTGIYQFVPGQQPQRISQGIEQSLRAFDTGKTNFRLFWDDRQQGLHVFCSPIVAPASTTHFFYDQRSGAWWEDQFGNSNHDPLTGTVFDGNLPTDRCVLLGSWDGYVRKLDPAALDDDGTAIDSEVVIGPFLTKDFDDVDLKDIQAIMGLGSGKVTFAMHTGATAQIALASQPVASGTWLESRNLTDPMRKSAHAFYIKLSSTKQWSMEQVRLRVALQGKARRRGG